MNSDDQKAEQNPVSLLNAGQRDCLRLVLLYMSSKQIARKLDISPHTVDQRIKVAMRLLGLSTRVEAAQALAAYEQNQPYQPLVYQAPDIAASSDPVTLLPLTEYGEMAEREHIEYRVSDVALDYVHIPLNPRSHNWPFPSYLGERNDLTYIKRFGWICAIAAIAGLSFGMILAGLDALGRLT